MTGSATRKEMAELVWKFALGANIITLEQAVLMIDLVLATHFATKVKRKFELGVACAREQDRREVESAAVIQEISSEEPDPGPAEAEVIEKFRAESIAEMLDEDDLRQLKSTDWFDPYGYLVAGAKGDVTNEDEDEDEDGDEGHDAGEEDDQGGDAGAHGQNCVGGCCAVKLPFTLPRC